MIDQSYRLEIYPPEDEKPSPVRLDSGESGNLTLVSPITRGGSLMSDPQLEACDCSARQSGPWEKQYFSAEDRASNAPEVHAPVHPDSAATSDVHREGKLPAGRFKSKRRVVAVLAVLVFVTTLAIGLGAGLTIGRRRSPVGAMDGSGIVGIDLADDSRRIVAFYQHAAGRIRRIDYQDGRWTDVDEIEAWRVPPREGTPLMAVEYSDEGESTWRVFYIDQDDHLREVIKSNLTNRWWEGPLGAQQIKASSSEHAGLTVCRNRQWYGNPGDPWGLRLYYGSAEGSIRELKWHWSDSSWDVGYTFPDSNGDGGVECTVRNTSTTYVWLLNTAGELELRWHDFDDANEGATHRTNQWVKGATYSPVKADSPIAAIQFNTTRLVHYQAPDGIVNELVTQGEAENLTWTGPYAIDAALEETKVGAVVLSTGLGGQEIHVLFQKTTRDITDFIRTLVGQTWAVIALPIE